jgi:two-component system, cell cycle response regulator DivK
MTSPDDMFLYVEDDGMSREIVEILFKMVMGYPNLIVFEDSANFMERLRALPKVPSLIMLDVQVGPHDAYQMLTMLRSDPAYEKTIVIAMTANVMSYDVEKLKQAGFNGLIGKPIMRDAFPGLIAKLAAGEPVWYVP